MMVTVRMDAEIGHEDTLPLSTRLPLGQSAPRLLDRNFVLVSRSRGVMGYGQEEDLLLPFIRMRVRDCWCGKALFDFRLYRWDACSCGWIMCRNTVELEDHRMVMKQAEPAPAANMEVYQ